MTPTEQDKHAFEQWWKANSWWGKEADFKSVAFAAFLGGRQSEIGKLHYLRSLVTVLWRHWKEERDARLDARLKLKEGS